MTISILTFLVTIETFIILLGIIIVLARKHSKLRKAFDKLLASLTENIFSKLVEEEIDKTNERAHEIIKDETDELDLADDATNDIDESELSEEEQELKRALTFRSAYLHAELNAFNASEGDDSMFWYYLAENIAPLMPGALQQTEEHEHQPVSNEFIKENKQELQDKLTKAEESNLSMQALLDSLLANGQLETEQAHIIKASQADFHDLSAHVSDLEQKIQNSLNIEITGSQSRPHSSVTEKTLIIEKTSNKVNVETNKLKDIIFDQGNKINQLLKQVKSGVTESNGTELLEQFEALERSQKETAMCMEVLEMENQRLQDELHDLEERYGSEGNSEMAKKIVALEKVINHKDQELEQLNKEFDSIQQEYMAVYDKGEHSS